MRFSTEVFKVSGGKFHALEKMEQKQRPTSMKISTDFICNAGVNKFWWGMGVDEFMPLPASQPVST